MRNRETLPNQTVRVRFNAQSPLLSSKSTEACTKSASVVNVTEIHTKCVDTPLVPPIQKKTLLRAKKAHMEKISYYQDEPNQPVQSLHRFAVLLAMTTIPPLRKTKTKKHVCTKDKTIHVGTKEKYLQAEAHFEPSDVSEKNYSIPLERNPLELLLRPSEIVTEIKESQLGSSDLDNLESIIVPAPLKKDLTSLLKTQSKTNLSPTDLAFVPAFSSPRMRARRRPSYQTESHPLCPVPEASNKYERNSLDKHSENNHNISKPRKRCIPFVITSEINSSPLSALKYAARSISSVIKPLPMVNNLITRPYPNSASFSVATIMSQLNNEPILPKIEDVPTTALRKYLNPITNAPIEAHASSSDSRNGRSRQCCASIQMQTFKVSVSRASKTPSIISRRTQVTEEEPSGQNQSECLVRQRDRRENGDFMRIAVMEMLMRKRGKLCDQNPGKARLALPPRTLVFKPYEITADGVPVRWIPSSP